MLNCANPECGISFDHRQGRLVRFFEAPSEDTPENSCVKHFWLCHNCSQDYSLEYQPGVGIAIMPRVNVGPQSLLHHVCRCPAGSRKNCRTEYSPKV